MILLSQEKKVNLFPFAEDYNPERSLLQVVKTPQGYDRYPAKKMTPYQAWLSNLPLKPAGTPIISWDGDTLTPPDSFWGVLDIPITSPEITDADVPMLLLLTFFKLSGQIDKIKVRLKDGVLLTYDLWLSGTYYEDAVKPPVYVEGERRPDSDEEFQAFLDFVFRNVDNKILKNNLKNKDARVLRPSQLFLQFKDGDPDSAGHTAIILDVAQSPGKKQKLLVAYGGNPAQSIIIPRAWAGDESMWFTYEELREYLKEYGVGWYFRYKNE
jgi:hypothetical protein